MENIKVNVLICREYGVKPLPLYRGEREIERVSQGGCDWIITISDSTLKNYFN
ncbi:hypothetical protein ACFL60_06610 [Candidatus Omnitrophota bacterium]